MLRMLNTLYVTNPDVMLRKKDDAISIQLKDGPSMSLPFHVLEGIVLFGHVGCSMAVLCECAKLGISVAFLDETGRFCGRMEGPTSGNVLLRRAQFSKSADGEYALAMAKRFVSGKVHNSEVVLKRFVRDYGQNEVVSNALIKLKDSSGGIVHAASLDELRGVEGDAAHVYFGVFGELLRVEDSSRVFRGRSRRPPKDPVNALLSFFYTLLSRECASACETVGLDPQVGFLHADRPGRSSLALDLVEELRAPFVDRFVLSLFNRGQVAPKDFHEQEGGVYLETEARKKLIGLWQERKQRKIMHPFLKEKVQIGVIPMLQARLLARTLRGDLDDYPAFLWR